MDGGSLWGLLLADLDQVAAGVVEDGHDDRSEIRRRLDEADTGCGEPRVLGLDVLDVKAGEGDPVGDESAPEGTHGRVPGKSILYSIESVIISSNTAGETGIELCCYLQVRTSALLKPHFGKFPFI